MEERTTSKQSITVRRLERHAELSVVQLLDQTPRRREQRIQHLQDELAARTEELKRQLWTARLEAFAALKAAEEEERVPTISRWRADAIDAAYREWHHAEVRSADRRFSRRAAKEAAAAQARLQELLELADCSTYEIFKARLAEQDGMGREERIAEAKVGARLADAAWTEFKDGRNQELAALESQLHRLQAASN